MLALVALGISSGLANTYLRQGSCKWTLASGFYTFRGYADHQKMLFADAQVST